MPDRLPAVLDRRCNEAVACTLAPGLARRHVTEVSAGPFAREEHLRHFSHWSSASFHSASCLRVGSPLCKTHGCAPGPRPVLP